MMLGGYAFGLSYAGGSGNDVVLTERCSGGGTSLGAPSSLSFPSVSLNGVNQVASTSLALTSNDQSTGSGWNITGTSTTFTNASSQTLATTATTIQSASAAPAGGTCSPPTNSVAYPLTMPAGSSPPTPTKLYNSLANTGGGIFTITLVFAVAVPANALPGTYTSTLTLGIASGP